MPSREATNTNFILFGLTGLEPTIYRTLGEHANHSITYVVEIYISDAIMLLEHHIMNIKCCPYGILKFSYSLKYVRLIENLWKFQISNFTQIIMHKQYLHDKSFLLVWLIIEFHFTQNSFKANQFLGHCCLSDWNSMGLKWMVISLVCEMMKELWISPHLCPKPIFWGECTEWEKDANTSMHSKLKKSHFMQNSF